MKGSAEMVNVMDKPVTERIAVAEAIVDLGDKAFLAVKENQVKKGSVLDVAQIAGIQGAKLTSQLIPLCHNISLTHVDITMELLDHAHSVKIIGSARAASKTGVEMEALTAVTVAALTVYDMCKSVSKQIIIRDVKLLKKMGGQSGDYQ
jgi:cyclic pyranopterin phosphate synthase